MSLTSLIESYEKKNLYRSRRQDLGKKKEKPDPYFDPYFAISIFYFYFYDRLEKARSAYVNFVLEGMGGGRREEFHSGNREGRLLGNDVFIQQALNMNMDQSPLSVGPEMIVDRVCEHFRISPSELSSQVRSRRVAEARAWVALLSVETRATTLTDLARRFGRDVATLSNGVQRLRQRIGKEEEMAGKLDRLRRVLGID